MKKEQALVKDGSITYDTATCETSKWRRYIAQCEKVVGKDQTTLRDKAIKAFEDSEKNEKNNKT